MSNLVQESESEIVSFADVYRSSRVGDATPLPAIENSDNRHRLMLLSRPSLVCECLHRTLREHGFDIVVQSLGDPVRPQAFVPEIIIFSVSPFDPDMLVTAQQRIGELHDLLPQAPIMALIEHADRNAARELARLGIATTVVGVPSISIAVAAIRFVLVGGPCVTAEIHLRLESGARPEDSQPIGYGCGTEAAGENPDNRFTEREAAVLQRLRQGQPNKVIAHKLGISESTVKVHLRSIMAKLKVTNRTQIVCILASSQDATTAPANPQGMLSAS